MAMPGERFDLVLCRNLVFTYFAEQLQREQLECIQALIVKGGALVIGIHEALPAGSHALDAWSDRLGIYIKQG